MAVVGLARRQDKAAPPGRTTDVFRRVHGTRNNNASNVLSKVIAYACIPHCVVGPDLGMGISIPYPDIARPASSTRLWLKCRSPLARGWDKYRLAGLTSDV
jgi:hypothetical protein